MKKGGAPVGAPPLGRPVSITTGAR